MHAARQVLTPDTFTMVDSISRNGSFAAAARELGVVPSALTYRVRLLEDALDVLLFDRSARQAQLTEAGRELLREGQRLLLEMDAVASRVKRVATGWEAQLTVCVDGIVSEGTILELCDAFYSNTALSSQSAAPIGSPAATNPKEGPPTKLKLLKGILSGTWEGLITGAADLVIGAVVESPANAGMQTMPLGDVPFVFCVAPNHPLAQHQTPLRDQDIQAQRAIAVADSAVRVAPTTVGLLPGQNVLTVATLEQKLHAQLRGLGCGFLPEPLARAYVQQGRLVVKATEQTPRVARLVYGWRTSNHPPGFALAWWLAQLSSPATRRALIERHGVIS
jgi:DNA-binding transcriptional LysR family regulator